MRFASLHRHRQSLLGAIRLSLAMGLILLVSLSAHSETRTVSLTSTDALESADAVVNSTLGYIHPKLKADNWDDGLGNGPTRSFSVGDGHHGAFESETDYLRYHDGTYLGDKVIRINTDTYPDLEFTRVHILSGWKIKPFGSQPLTIRSLSTIAIDAGAEVDCSGGDGEGIKSLGLTAAGGVGRCGGADGGQGGATPTDGQTPAFNAGGGGHAGPAAGDGGGGGGAIAQVGAPGADGVASGGGVGGAGGTNTVDDGFTTVAGGSGGGGGKSDFDSSGAGGGAGGGSIYLYAVDGINVAATGIINVNGGNGGGGSVGTGHGGAGGGGGGGSLLAFSRGAIVFDGTVTALAGAGGTTDGGDGGAGADGRTWVIDNDGISDGVGENPATFLILIGTVQYELATYTAISKTIDLANSKPQLISATVDATLGGSGTVALEVAGSDAPFDAASATWIPAASIASLSGMRYLRFRLTLTNADEEMPTLARSVAIEYQPGEQGKFDFSSCALNQQLPPRPGGGGWIVFLLTLPVALIVRLRESIPKNP